VVLDEVVDIMQVGMTRGHDSEEASCPASGVFCRVAEYHPQQCSARAFLAAFSARIRSSAARGSSALRFEPLYSPMQTPLVFMNEEVLIRPSRAGFAIKKKESSLMVAGVRSA
jgi:hypothetical protein